MIKQSNAVKTDHDIYPAIVTNATHGWVGSGFNRRYTEMKVRRIPAGKGGSDTTEHVQIEIGIDTYKGATDRRYTEGGSFTLTPEQVEKLVAALTKPVTY